MLPERALAYPVTLRPFGLRDAPRVQVLAGEREVAAMTALIPHPYPDGAAAQWIAGQAREQAAGREYTYAITSSNDATLVGAIGLRPVDEREKLAFWSAGRCGPYATAAARAVIHSQSAPRIDTDRIATTRIRFGTP